MDNDQVLEERVRSRPNGRTLTAVAVGALLIGGTGLGVALSNDGNAATTSPSCGSSSPHLTVQGTGKATATPDLLTAVIQFNSTAGSATTALSQDNTKVSQALLAFAANGVTQKEVQTSNLTVQTVYAYPKGVPTVTGYQVSNTITASIHDTKKAGAAIDAVVAAAGNAAQINSLTFSFDNPTKVEDQARKAAVRQAVSRAKAMAAGAGRRLGSVCSIADSTPSGQLQNTAQSFAASGAVADSAAAPVPLESGTQGETDQVTVVYAVTSR